MHLKCSYLLAEAAMLGLFETTNLALEELIICDGRSSQEGVAHYSWQSF